MHRRLAILFGLVWVSACTSDPRTERLDDVLWPTAPETRVTEEPVNYVERTAGVGYALPAAGQKGIADLIALFPEGEIQRDDPNIFVSDVDAFNCVNGKVEARVELPMEVEGVVTLHPRQYQKSPICDQDERHYGSFTIEDDDAGIVVLRDSRVADFTAGDRVRLKVTALMLSYFRRPETRLVVAADVERVEPPSADVERPVLYTQQTEKFSGEDVGFTRRVEGWVVQTPTNNNYSALMLGSHFPGLPGDGPIDPVCDSECRGRCDRKCAPLACAETICPALCKDGARSIDEADVPICWELNLDPELVRRRVTPAVGTHMAAMGPVVDSFGLKIWVQRVGQLETLE